MSQNTNEPLCVIYIMSDRRSGSTLLENILSKSDEIISVGEMAMLNGHILKKGGGERWDWNCSCGLPVLKCPFWIAVLGNKNYFETITTPQTQTKWRGKFFAIILFSAFPSLTNKFISFLNGGKKNKLVIDTLNKLYNSVSEISGKKIIVDSSKDPDQLSAIYKSNRNFNMKIIWLKKDLRSIAASKSKWREKNKKQKFPLSILLLVAFFYKRTCYAVSKIIDKNILFTLDYEALATSPQEQLNLITNQFGMQSYNAPGYLEVAGQHTIAGTPERFSNKPIKLDEAWKKAYSKNKFAYKFGAALNKLSYDR